MESTSDFESPQLLDTREPWGKRSKVLLALLLVVAVLAGGHAIMRSHGNHTEPSILASHLQHEVIGLGSFQKCKTKEKACENCENEGYCRKCEAEVQLDRCEMGCGPDGEEPDKKKAIVRSKCCGMKVHMKQLSVLEECQAAKGAEGHKDWEDCSIYGKCNNTDEKCYKKDKWYAACMKTCDKNLGGDTWSCEEFKHSDKTDLNCAEDHEHCGKYGKCCQTPGHKCYLKETWGKGGSWASCRPDCKAGETWDHDPPEHKTPWKCILLGRATTTAMADTDATTTAMADSDATTTSMADPDATTTTMADDDPSKATA